MPITFSSILTGMAKGYIKNQLQKKGLEVINKTITSKTKREISKNVITKNNYKFRKSDRDSNYSVYDLNRDIKTVERFFKTTKSQNVYDIAYNIKNFFGKVDKKISKNEKIKELKELQEKFKLNQFDRYIFELSQKKEGTFTIKDLKNDAKEYFKQMYGNTKKAEDIYKNFEKYVDFRRYSLAKVGFLNVRSGGIYEVTEHFYNALERQELFKDIVNKSSIQNDIKVTNFHKYILSKAKENNGQLSLDALKEEYKNDIKVTDPDKKLSMVQNSSDKLTKSGYLKYEDGKYFLTTKGENVLKEIDKNITIGYADVRIYRMIDQEKGTLSIERLKEKITDKNKQDMAIGRLKKLEQQGYLEKTSKGYIKTKKGERQIKEFLLKQKQDKLEKLRRDFKYSTFDTHILKAAKRQRKINLNELKKELETKYKDNKKEINRQLKMWEVRCKKLEKVGYLEKTEEGYKITDEGKNILLDKIIKDVRKLAKNYRLDEERYEHILNRHGPLSKIKNKSKFYKDFNIKKGIEDTLKDSNSKIDFNKNYKGKERDGYIFEKTYSQPIGIDNNEKCYTLRVILLDNGDVKTAFPIKNKDIKVDKDSYKNTQNIEKLSSLDIRIFNELERQKGILSIEKFEIYAREHYGNEADRQLKILTKRIEKLEESELLKKINNEYHMTDKCLQMIAEREQLINEKNKLKQNMIELKKDSNKAKITKFDYNNILEVANGSIWTKESYKEHFSNLSNSQIEQKLKSIEKRLNTFEELGLVKKIDGEKYELNKKLLDRARMFREKEKYNFSTEQKETLTVLKDFLNLTDKQIAAFIYKENEVFAQSDVNQLVRKGYLGETTRDLKGDGEFTKVYYLTTEGKKAASHLTGTEMKDIYNSKLHNRPEELRHDLLVYSAYKDMKETLEDNNYRITKTMTDKQMRASDMKETGHQRTEYSDLYIEFEDVKTKEKGYINIEVDAGYKPNVIRSKAENIDNLVWYTDTENQSKTIQKVLPDAKVIVLDF